MNATSVRRSLASLVTGLVVSFSTAALAQVPAVPAASPRARAEQEAGINKFTIDYSSPGVKGRKIYGGLVPYGQVWRAGANATTKLTAAREFSVGGKKVPAGTYGVMMIPNPASWTVILTSDPQVQQASYDPKKDVARVEVKAETLPAPRERLTYSFSDTTDTSTNLDLEWERVRVRVPLQIDTAAQVQASIKESLEQSWRPHHTAAQYLLESNGDLGRALEYANTSIAIKPTWWNNWVKAQILGKTGKKAEAVAAAEQAKTLGKGDYVYENFFAPQIAAAIKGWK